MSDNQMSYQQKLAEREYVNIINGHQLEDGISADLIRNSIIHGDCLDIMKKIKSGTVNLVVTSPPYNLRNSTGNGMKDGRGGKWANAALIKGYAEHEDNMPYDKYVEWQRACLSEMLRLISDDGAIFLQS